jgi:hypothetical protein
MPSGHQAATAIPAIPARDATRFWFGLAWCPTLLRLAGVCGDEVVEGGGDVLAGVFLQVMPGGRDPFVALPGGALDVALEVLVDGDEPERGLVGAERGLEGPVELGELLPAFPLVAEPGESVRVGMSCGIARAPAL